MDYYYPNIPYYYGYCCGYYWNNPPPPNPVFVVVFVPKAGVVPKPIPNVDYYGYYYGYPNPVCYYGYPNNPCY